MNTEDARVSLASQTKRASPPVVLLVEDEEVVREITGQVLENAGYHVLESASPREALNLARSRMGSIDLLLTDVVMPEMNGVELANKLWDLNPGLATVFMSGYAEGELLRKAHSRSATHIQKPFTIDLLLARVADALNACACR